MRRVSLAEKIKAIDDRYKAIIERRENVQILEKKITKVSHHTENLKELMKITDLPAGEVSCSICMENQPIVVFSCGHKKTCVKCSLQILISTNVCPHCRKPIKSAVRVFE